MLTREDIDVLIEATEAWESKDAAGELMGDLLQGMLSRGDEKTLAEMKQRKMEETRKREQEKKLRKERSIILRAKLISLRDSMDADSLLKEASAVR